MFLGYCQKHEGSSEPSQCEICLYALRYAKQQRPVRRMRSSSPQSGRHTRLPSVGATSSRSRQPFDASSVVSGPSSRPNLPVVDINTRIDRIRLAEVFRRETRRPVALDIGYLPSFEHVRPDQSYFPEEGFKLCKQVAIAVDSTLAGYPMTTVPPHDNQMLTGSEHRSEQLLIDLFGPRVFFDDRARFFAYVTQSRNQRFIVGIANRDGSLGHAFNFFVDQANTPVLVDAVATDRILRMPDVLTRMGYDDYFGLTTQARFTDSGSLTGEPQDISQYLGLWRTAVFRVWRTTDSGPRPYGL